MSRSNPQLTNPATRFFEWKGQGGTLEFYDKEQEKRINVPLPFTFLPLDELFTMVGYNSRDKSGYWSNEIRNIIKDMFIVRTKQGIADQGVYNDLAISRGKGAKLARSVYMAYKTRDGWQIGNFKASGSALSAWIEFSKTCKPETGKVTISRGAMQESPVGEFYPPELTFEVSSHEEDAVAIQLDRELQSYLEQYLKQPPVTDIEDEIVNGVEEPVVVTDDIVQTTSRSQGEPQSGYDKAKAQAARLADKREDEAIRELVQNEPLPEEPINLDDIPF